MFDNGEGQVLETNSDRLEKMFWEKTSFHGTNGAGSRLRKVQILAVWPSFRAR